MRRTRQIAGWLVPAAVIALMPKCPLCIAGYMAILTGFGISVSAIAGLRLAILCFAFGSLLYLSVCLVFRLRLRNT